MILNERDACIAQKPRDFMVNARTDSIGNCKAATYKSAIYAYLLIPPKLLPIRFGQVFLCNEFPVLSSVSDLKNFYE